MDLADTDSSQHDQRGLCVSRQRGLSIQEIFKSQLARFPELQGLVDGAVETSPRTTSFRCRVFDKIVGPNWLVVGEAAAMVDPMTSSGVTAALRHAEEASKLIVRYRDGRRLSLPIAMYSRRLVSLAIFFNEDRESDL